MVVPEPLPTAPGGFDCAVSLALTRLQRRVLNVRLAQGSAQRGVTGEDLNVSIARGRWSLHALYCFGSGWA